MDWSLILTIGLIFLASLVGAYVRANAKDRCLRSYHDFHVTLERTDDKLVWGVLQLEPTGMEFLYQDAVQDDRHLETSYVLYSGEYNHIQAIYRYADNLSDWGRKQRVKDIERSFHPNPFRRLMRAARNFLGTATDAFNESLGVLLGRASGKGRVLTDQGSSAIKSLSGKVLGSVGSQFDPLLEHHIGHRVVFELVEANEVHEHVGILKEYSSDFIEVLDVQYPERRIMPIKLGQDFRSERLIITCADGKLSLTNRDQWPVLVQSLKSPEREQLVNAVVDLGETIELNMNQDFLDDATLHMQVVRELDMIVPRSRCVIRHRAEKYANESLAGAVLDLVFDVGKAFNGDAEDQSEQELRVLLQRDGSDPLAAANLGSLLMKKDRFQEAEKWLRLAMQSELLLPDGGKRVRMQLRELQRRNAPRTGQPAGKPAEVATPPGPESTATPPS